MAGKRTADCALGLGVCLSSYLFGAYYWAYRVLPDWPRVRASPPSQESAPEGSHVCSGLERAVAGDGGAAAGRRQPRRFVDVWTVSLEFAGRLLAFRVSRLVLGCVVFCAGTRDAAKTGMVFYHPLLRLAVGHSGTVYSVRCIQRSFHGKFALPSLYSFSRGAQSAW